MFAISDNFVINPPNYYIPSIRIGPYLSNIHYDYLSHVNSKNVDIYLKNKFNNRNYIYTSTARSALNIALSDFRLELTDVVSIFTTTGNKYISNCVTEEISKFCLWSRKVEPDTKVILVIHEFGYPYERLDELKKYDLPIIEDCAYSFQSQNSDKTVGSIGDYTIYSLPKFFPIQIGGILTCKSQNKINTDLDIKIINYIKSCLTHDIENIERISEKRISNYNYLKDKFSSISIEPFFHAMPNAIPGVFMFKLNSSIDKALLKKWVWRHGIECSVFYDMDAFFVPTHQNLEHVEMDYIYEVIKYFILNQKKSILKNLNS